MPKMGTANARKNRRVIEDHNAARWLEVRYLPTKLLTGAAWYVVRTCPCHKDERVTYPLDTEEQAQRALSAMLEVSA
jgi:hypothetical protein